MRALLLWRDLEMPLKVAVLVAVMAGVGGIVSASLYHQVDYSAPPVSLILEIGSVLPLTGAASVIFVPMNRDRRNIVGFLTFIIALPVLFGAFEVFAFLFLPS